MQFSKKQKFALFGLLLLGVLISATATVAYVKQPGWFELVEDRVKLLVPTLSQKKLDQVKQPAINLNSCDEKQSLQSAKNCTYLIITDQGHGSGFAISDQYVVTNKHVIDGAKQIFTWFDGQNTSLELWNYSHDVDLAVLRLPDKGRFLTSCLWADSNSIQLAETLYAVGWPNSKDGESSITRGIFSRFIQTDQGPLFIQTDAAINPGNSGGPLVNQCGIVGVNTAKIVWSEQNVPAEGFSFAIASNYVQDQVEQLIESGKTHQLPVKNLDQTKYSPQTAIPDGSDSGSSSGSNSSSNRYSNLIIPEEVKQSWRQAEQATHELDQYWSNHSAGVDQDKLNRLRDLIARMKTVIAAIVPKIEQSQALTQAEQDLLPQWNEMYSKAVVLEGELHQRDYTQGYYHYQCQNNSCILISGRGFDNCTSGNDCLPEYHYECQDLACMIVEGKGQNSCNSHDDCYHYRCQDQQCQKVAGDGADDCYWDIQCQ
ncbi:MAG: trypsin-like serine protease [Candidatus Pacebacteria bacterium]|nr:trypsin-like serine protease [Candidatus Paceibacterota bacterium]